MELDYKKLNSVIRFDLFYLYFSEDFFNKGDILKWSNSEAKIVRTYRKTWWRILLLKIGFNIKMNSNGIVIYKVKLLK